MQLKPQIPTSKWLFDEQRQGKEFKGKMNSNKCWTPTKIVKRISYKMLHDDIAWWS